MTIRILKIAKLKARTGLSSSTIWRMERKGKFPSRRQLSPNRVGWIENEVQSWLTNRSNGIVAPKNEKDIPSGEKNGK